MSNKNHRRFNSDSIIMILTLKEFLELYPWVKESLPDDFDFDDDNYLVKINTAVGRIDIGYSEDIIDDFRKVN